MENFEKAVPLLREGIKRLTDTKGNGAPETRIAVTFLARALMGLGKEVEAGEIMIASINAGANRRTDTESLCKEIIANSERENGEEHPLTLKALDETGIILYNENKVEAALKYLTIAFERSDNTFGQLAEETLIRAANLADIYQRAGYFSKAVPIFRRIASSDFSSPKAMIKAFNDLANVLIKTEEYAEAIIINKKILDTKKSLYGDTNLTTLKTLSLLNFLYEKTGQDDKYKLGINELSSLLNVISQPNLFKSITDRYTEKSKKTKDKRISESVAFIKEQQRDGKLEYLGNTQAKLEEAAETMTKDSLDQDHPEGADEIELLIDILNTLVPHQSSLDIWDSVCEHIENNLESNDIIRPFARLHYSQWLIHHELFTRAKENLQKVWVDGDLSSNFVCLAGRTFFNVVAYDADKDTITEIADQMISDLEKLSDINLPEIHYFKTQAAAYFMECEAYPKAAELYTEILKQQPSGEGGFLFYFNEMKGRLGEALAFSGRTEEGVVLCQEAWNYFEGHEQHKPHYAYIGCGFANVLELAGKTKLIPELRRFAMQHASIQLNKTIYEKPDYGDILNQIIILQNITDTASKTDDFGTLKKMLVVLAIAQKRIGYYEKMNETLWLLIKNIDHFEDKEETFGFVMNLWEQTEQHEMIDKLKSMINDVN